MVGVCCDVRVLLTELCCQTSSVDSPGFCHNLHTVQSLVHHETIVFAVPYWSKLSKMEDKKIKKSVGRKLSAIILLGLESFFYR